MCTKALGKMLIIIIMRTIIIIMRLIITITIVYFNTVLATLAIPIS